MTAFWKRELSLCEEVALKHQRNYYAWTHRLWCSRHFSEPALESELAWVTAFVKQHVSDRSAAHYHEQVLRLLLASPPSPSSPLPSVRVGREVAHAAELVLCLPGHESLWHHLRELTRVALGLGAPTSPHDLADGARRAICSACDALASGDTVDGSGSGVGGGGSRSISSSSNGGGSIFAAVDVEEVPSLRESASWSCTASAALQLAARVAWGEDSWDKAAAQRRCGAAYGCAICFHLARAVQPVSPEMTRHLATAGAALCKHLIAVRDEKEAAGQVGLSSSHFCVVGPGKQMWSSLLREFESLLMLGGTGGGSVE